MSYFSQLRLYDSFSADYVFRNFHTKWSILICDFEHLIAFIAKIQALQR
jgi:hypothetical protein